METILSVVTTFAFLSALIFFVIFIARAIKKQKKKVHGMIALISFIILFVVAWVGGTFYLDEDKETHLGQVEQTDSSSAQELTIESSNTNKKEIVITPKNGRKLKVMEQTLTFRIGTIIQDSLGINITFQANGAIPLLDRLETPVAMKIVIDNQTLESSNPKMSGLIKDSTLQGYLTFTFPTTKTPNEIIVYNRDNKSIKFKVKNK